MTNGSNNGKKLAKLKRQKLDLERKRRKLVADLNAIDLKIREIEVLIQQLS